MTEEHAIELSKRNAACIEQIIELLAKSLPMLETDLSAIHADWRRELLELDAHFDDPDLRE